MKKILSGITIIFVLFTTLFIFNNEVEADIDHPFDYEVRVEINWIDFDDFLGERPTDSVTLLFKDDTHGSEVSVNLKKSECTVTNDSWRGTVYLPKYRPENQNLSIEYTWVGFTGEVAKKYEKQEYSSSYVSEDNSYVTAYMLSNLNDTYTFTVNWDDDNDRDGYRPENYFEILMKDNKNKESLVEIDRPNGNPNVWTAEALLSRYLYNERQEPILDPPISYEAKLQQPAYNFQQIVDNYEYSFEIDGTNVTMNAKHEPERLDYNIPVKVTWNDEENKDGKRPQSLGVQAVANETTKSDKAQLDETSNWQYEFSNLYKHTGEYPWHRHIDAEYNMIVDETPNYTFEVKKLSEDQKDGFEIIATYVPDPVVETETQQQPSTEQNTPTVEEKAEETPPTSPKTGANYSNIWAVIALAVTSALAASIIIIKKKFFKK